MPLTSNEIHAPRYEFLMTSDIKPNQLDLYREQAIISHYHDGQTPHRADAVNDKNQIQHFIISDFTCAL